MLKDRIHLMISLGMKYSRSISSKELNVVHCHSL